MNKTIATIKDLREAIADPKYDGLDVAVWAGNVRAQFIAQGISGEDATDFSFIATNYITDPPPQQ